MAATRNAVVNRPGPLPVATIAPATVIPATAPTCPIICMSPDAVAWRSALTALTTDVVIAG